jgi:hypothetical protein
MDYHKNARLTIHGREELARKLVETMWVGRFRQGGRSALADHSSRPHRFPRYTPRNRSTASNNSAVQTRLPICPSTFQSLHVPIVRPTPYNNPDRKARRLPFIYEHAEWVDLVSRDAVI